MKVNTMTINYGVLTLDSVTILTDPDKIIAYTLTKYLTTPKSLSMSYREDIISAADVISKNSIAPDTVANQMEKDIKGCLSRIFNDTMNVNVTVTIDTKDYNSFTNINANIDVSMQDDTGKVYKVVKPFFVDDNKNIVIGTNPDGTITDYDLDN